MRALRLAAGVSVLLGFSDANATTCSYQHEWRSLPLPFEPAAPNTHFWLFAPPDWDRRVCDQAYPGTSGNDADPSAACRSGRFTLKLFEAPSRLAKGPIEIPSSLRRHVTGQSALIELVPNDELTAGKRYDAHLVDAGGGPHRLVGTFRVGPAKDEFAPTWSGIENAVRYRKPPAKHTSGKHRVVTIDMMDAKPGILVTFQPMHGASLFAVWTGPPGQSLDFTREPLTYDVPFSGVISELDLGGSDMCWTSSFVIPDESEIRIGLRAVDLAGNASTPSEIDVKLK